MPEPRTCRPPNGTREGAVCLLVDGPWPHRLQWRWRGNAWERSDRHLTPEAAAAVGWRFDHVVEGHPDG
jgi:hypothetical protein